MRAAAAGMASSPEEVFLFLVDIVEVETWGILVDCRDDIIIWGKLISPGGELTQSPRGGGERCRQLTKPSPSRRGGRIVLVSGLVTSQCPIVPAWRRDRIKSELLYLLYISTYL